MTDKCIKLAEKFAGNKSMTGDEIKNMSVESTVYGLIKATDFDTVKYVINEFESELPLLKRLNLERIELSDKMKKINNVLHNPNMYDVVGSFQLTMLEIQYSAMEGYLKVLLARIDNCIENGESCEPEVK